MATSGQLNTNTTYDSYFWVKWAQVGNQDAANNRTQINWSCGLYTTHKFYSNAIKMSAFSINGVQVYSGGTYSNFTAEGNQTIASGTMWINHNSDGSKTFSISSFTGWLYSNYNYSCNGGSFTLTQIPRQATITSVSDFSDQDNPKFSFSNPGGFTMDVWLEPNPVGDHLCIRKNISNTGSYQWTLSAAEREELRYKSNGKTQYPIRVGLYTYIGGTQYADYKDKTFTITENAATKPSVGAEIHLNNGTLPSKFDGMYIQGKSRLDIGLSATGKYGATITSLYAVIDGKTYTTPSFTSDVIKASGDVVTYAKDSRGFTNSNTQPISVVEYSKPLVVSLSSENAVLCYRSDGNGKRVGNSTSVWIKAKRSYYSLSGKNQCALQWRKKLTTEEWNDSTHLWVDLVGKSNTSTDEYNALISGETFELKKSYTVQIRVIDDIGEYDVKTLEIPTMDVALHLGKGGKNVSVGTYCDYSKDYTFCSAWDIYINNNKVIADAQLNESVHGVGWRKIGTINADIDRNMCSVTTITIGGVYYYNPVTPAMVDIATHWQVAKAYLRLPTLLDSQISKIGITKEADLQFGVYIYYTSEQLNYVSINVHPHMGEFQKANWEVSDLTDADFVETINLKA